MVGADEEFAACRLDELEPAQPKLITVRGRKIVLVRIGDEVRALQNACPHKGAPLCEGSVSVARRELVCPWHRFRFRLDDGASVTNPNLIAPPYRVRVAGDSVYITLERPRRNDASGAGGTESAT